MRWLLLTVFLLTTQWIAADNARKPNLDPISDRISNGGKNQKKRGVVGGVPTFSKGIDMPFVRHSILKPFLVKYPMQTVPIGVKIPLRLPANGFRHMHGHQAPMHHGVAPPVQKPTQLHPSVARPAQPTQPAQPAQPLPCHIAPARIPVVFKPIVPAVHFTPAAAPAVPLTPLLPLPLPPPPFISKPLARPFVPVASPVPVAPISPAVIKPGHSVQTSFFATYPRHPIIPGGPVVPVAPVAPPVPLGHVPLPVHQPPLNLAPIPLHVNRIPFNVVNPVHHVHHAATYPVQPPINFFHHAPVPSHPIPDIPINFAHGFVNQGPTNVPLGVGEIPASVGQNPFFLERPHVQFSSPGFVHPSESPGVQEQGNENNFIHNVGAEGSGVWTPMSTSATSPQYPDQFFPETEAPNFPNQDGSSVHPTTDHNQGYHYQAPNVPFHEVNQQHQYHQQDQFQNAQFASNVQHEPQLPQALPDHHLSGKPIDEAYQNHFALRQHPPLNRPYENFSGYHQ